MHIHKSSFAGGFRILVDRRGTPAVSARPLGCGFGTVIQAGLSADCVELLLDVRLR